MHKPKKRRVEQNRESENVGKNTTISKRAVSGNWLAFQGTLPKAVHKSSHFEQEHKQISSSPKEKRPAKVTKALGLDCEMVGNLQDENMLARVSIVNYHLECVYDKFVKPTDTVGDYRTRYSGIRPSDIANGEDFDKVQKEVKELLFSKILVGHALRNDLNVLKMGHHSKLIRDTTKYKPFKDVSDGRTPSLKKLAEHFLKESIQDGEHNSIEDARASMKLYKMHRYEWEKAIFSKSTET